MGCVPSRKNKCKSANVGCNYRATTKGNSVTISSSVVNSRCKTTFGLGNATFKIDPKDPPATIKRIITADASGSYAPMEDVGGTRHTKSFESLSIRKETFKDAKGTVTEITYPELIGYKEHYVAGKYVASGIETSSTGTKLNW